MKLNSKTRMSGRAREDGLGPTLPAAAIYLPPKAGLQDKSLVREASYTLLDVWGARVDRKAGGKRHWHGLLKSQPCVHSLAGSVCNPAAGFCSPPSPPMLLQY